MSGRHWQRALGQWTKGKAFDTFCPIGPVIATEVGDPNKLGIKCRLNGKTMQASTIFTLASLILRLVIAPGFSPSRKNVIFHENLHHVSRFFSVQKP